MKRLVTMAMLVTAVAAGRQVVAVPSLEVDFTQDVGSYTLHLEVHDTLAPMGTFFIDGVNEGFSNMRDYAWETGRVSVLTQEQVNVGTHTVEWTSPQDGTLAGNYTVANHWHLPDGGATVGLLGVACLGVAGVKRCRG